MTQNGTTPSSSRRGKQKLPEAMDDSLQPPEAALLEAATTTLQEPEKAHSAQPLIPNPALTPSHQEISASLLPLHAAAAKIEPFQPALEMVSHQLLDLTRTLEQVKEAQKRLDERVANLEQSLGKTAQTQNTQAELKQKALASLVQEQVNQVLERLDDLERLVETKSLILASKEDLLALEKVPAAAAKKLPEAAEKLIEGVQKTESVSTQLTAAAQTLVKAPLRHWQMLAFQVISTAVLATALAWLALGLYPPQWAKESRWMDWRLYARQLQSLQKQGVKLSDEEKALLKRFGK